MASVKRLLGALGVALGMLTMLVQPLPGSVVVGPLLLVAGTVGGFVYPFLRRRFPSLNIDLDLTYVIQHMLAVSTGKPPRRVLFEVVGREHLYPGYAWIFKKIYLLGKEWGYSFTDACKLVARGVYNKVVREFLVRLGGVLAVGEDVELFLRTEYSTIITEYETYYTRLIDAARVFLGIYISLLAASVFMLANFLLLSFFFGGTQGLIIASFGVVTLTVASTTIVLLVLLPREVFENKVEPRPRVYRVIDILALIGLAAITGLGALIFSTRGFSYENLSLVMAVGGVLLLAPGLLAKGIEKTIREVDEFFPVFIRSYGMHLQTIPQMARALKPLLAAELGKLNRFLQNLYSRLLNEIDPPVAWRLFAAETRSELVHRGVTIFLDTVEKGGDVAKVGAMLSDHHNTVIRLRKSRFQVAKTFETTTYMMHMAVVLITVFVTKLMYGFASIMQRVQSQLPGEVAGVLISGQMPLDIVVASTGMFVISTTVFNSIAILKAMPGVSRTFWYYMGLLSIIAAAGIMGGKYLMDLILTSTLETLNETLTAP